jgi:hypothetical protein
VFAIILGFFCSPFTDLAFVLERYHSASIFLHPVNVSASVCAAISAMPDGEGRDG